MVKQIKKQKLTNEEIEFLSESNKIEGEDGEIGSEAMEDVIKAWEYAKKEVKKNKGRLNIDILLGIHKRLLQRLALHYAGKIRTGAVMIGGEVRRQSQEEIYVELERLFEEWNYKRDEDSSEENEYFIKTWHIEYEKCHPFSDGNGRSGRILMNLQRLELGLPILIIHVGQEQQKYYQWFRGN